MKLLAIDTSTHQATVAVSVGETILVDEQQTLRQHAASILPMIERLMQQAALDWTQLDGIVLGRGPGSFTGLRISCSVAKGLAFAHDLAVYPVSSLAAIAYQAFQQAPAEYSHLPVLATIDARMQQLYWSCYDSHSWHTEEFVTDAQRIQLMYDGHLILAGVGFEPYFVELPTAIQQSVMWRYPILPHAKAMIQLVQANHIDSVSASEVLPIYVRNNVTQGAPRG